MYFVKMHVRPNMFVRSFVESCPGQVLNNIDFGEKNRTLQLTKICCKSVSRELENRGCSSIFPVQTRSWTVFISSEIPAV